MCVCIEELRSPQSWNTYITYLTSWISVAFVKLPNQTSF